MWNSRELLESHNFFALSSVLRIYIFPSSFYISFLLFSSFWDSRDHARTNSSSALEHLKTTSFEIPKKKISLTFRCWVERKFPKSLIFNCLHDVALGDEEENQNKTLLVSKFSWWDLRASIRHCTMRPLPPRSRSHSSQLRDVCLVIIQLIFVSSPFNTFYVVKIYGTKTVKINFPSSTRCKLMFINWACTFGC